MFPLLQSKLSVSRSWKCLYRQINVFPVVGLMFSLYWGKKIVQVKVCAPTNEKYVSTTGKVICYRQINVFPLMEKFRLLKKIRFYSQNYVFPLERIMFYVKVKNMKMCAPTNGISASTTGKNSFCWITSL